MPDVATPYPRSKPLAALPFLTLSENRLAYAAIRQLLTQRSRLVYLYGPSGVGKSHLASEFLRQSRLRDRDSRAASLTASEFCARVAEESANRSLPDVLEPFLTTETFVCEDLASLQKRYESQKLLVSVLDGILQSGGRCLLTCRFAPGELNNVLPRLVNRCRGGTVIRLSAPDQPSRKGLISHFAQQSQIPLPDRVAEYLSAELPVSPRELQAVVHQLEEHARKSRADIDLPLSRQFLNREVRPNHVSLSEIGRAVSRQFGTTLAELRKPSRTHGQVVPRQVAMYLARQLTQASMGQIATYFGRRNHSTVVHACQRVTDSLVENAMLRQHLTQIRSVLSERLS
jgi:chromosomal replication initiator protein